MKKLLYVSILGCLFIGCTSKSDDDKKMIEWSKEKSADFGKEMAKDEEVEIKLFLASHPDWKMQETGTGLRYFIYEHGDGDSAKSGKLAEVNFRINLLDGKECYKTETGETERFEIDRSEIETGVQEGVKKMRVGDKAKFIVPSHLAHGLVGDMNKIPPLTTIVVDMQLLKIIE